MTSSAILWHLNLKDKKLKARYDKYVGMHYIDPKAVQDLMRARFIELVELAWDKHKAGVKQPKTDKRSDLQKAIDKFPNPASSYKDFNTGEGVNLGEIAQIPPLFSEDEDSAY